MSVGLVSPMGAFHYDYGNHLRVNNHSPPEAASRDPAQPEISCCREENPDAVNAPPGVEKTGEKDDSPCCNNKEDEKEEPGASLTAELSSEEEEQVRELKNRDREVKAHEQAHVAAGGRYVNGGAHYELQTGPDGRQYAVGGEVSIDVSPVSGDPLGTIQKAQTVKRAAMAPANPSAQDRRVAAKAARMEAEARGDLAEQKIEEAKMAAEQKAQGQDNAPGLEEESDSSATATKNGPKGCIAAYTAHNETPKIEPQIAERLKNISLYV